LISWPETAEAEAWNLRNVSRRYTAIDGRPSGIEYFAQGVKKTGIIEQCAHPAQPHW
jgi:hypothetical protein